jgi:hypothetical protein
MQRARTVMTVVALAFAGCGDNLRVTDEEQVDPSAAAKFRGYAAVQDDLYGKFIAADSPFELFRYLGDSGEELSRLVGRPDGFGVNFDVRNNAPNGMNVLVWRMMLSRFASDLAARCPSSQLVPAADPAIALDPNAAEIADALCAWPAVDDVAIGRAWDLVVGVWASKASREAFLRFAHSPDLQGRSADEALPSLWLGALLHPAFLLEQ